MGPRGREAALGADSHIPIVNRPNPTFALAARSTRFHAPQLNEERLAAELHRIHRSHGANQSHRPDDIFKIGNKRWLLVAT